MTRAGGLGRGLGALIPSGETVGTPTRVSVDDIVANSRQPRRDFDEEALHELAASIRELGVLQPILVRRTEDGFEIIAGERRYRAARLAGLRSVPVVVRATDDDAMLVEALVENIHRADLNALEEAAAYRQLLDDLGLTHDALAVRLGRSRSALSNSLRLLQLPAQLQERVATGVLSAGHARALLGLPEPADQVALAQRVVTEALSVRATERLVRERLEGPTHREATPRRGPFTAVERLLSERFSTKVEVRGSERRGRVVINFSGREDLDRVMRALEVGVGEVREP